VTDFEQTEIKENIDWFQNNDNYITAQANLEYYRHIERMIRREIRGEKMVLDVGNGGFFNYDTQLAGHVTAVDLFLKDGPGHTPNSTLKQGSILAIPFPTESFDCIILQNVLHHVTGRSVRENHKNLSGSLAEMYRCVKKGGKVVLIESTVGKWFYTIERVLFKPILAIKKGGHPVTFQYTPGHIIDEALTQGFEMIDYADVPARGLYFLQAGYKWPTLLSPARAIKLVLTKG
jgi:ubiquinone/menaquinone biosynthesis C-methylase UbiE